MQFISTMTTAYSPQFSKQTFLFDNKVDIYRSRSDDNEVPQYFVFLDGKLYNFKYDNFNTWHTTLLLSETFKTQVLFFPKTLTNGESIMLLKTNDGIDIYQYIDKKFNLLSRSYDFDENYFHDVYDWDKPGNIVKSGNFFFDKNLIGILSKHQEYGLHVHAVKKDELMSGEYPILLLKTDLSVLGNTSNSHFFLADLQSKGQENIIVRTRSGMNVYEFNQRHGLQHLFQIPDSSRISDVEENLFFPSLTGQTLKDIILFNSSGLFIYQYDMKQKNYNFIYYNSLFDKFRGWDDKYIETVRFEDINFDGREEMFFTGPGGMDILTFNNYTLQWSSVLDISEIPVAKRHSYIVDIGSSKTLNVKYPILFTRRENQLHWANIEESTKQLYDHIDGELFNETSSNVSPTLSAIPSLIKLELTDEAKPHILLRDELDCSSILKAVDQDTGKANFKLPLIGFPNFPKNEKINFYYNGNNKASSILGVGWSFPIGVITMDHRGSIFSEDERYFLLVEDIPQQLLFDSDHSTDSIQFFKLSDKESNIQILYYKIEERWEIDYRGVKHIYGRCQNSHKDAISLDLAWKFWRGAGSSPLGQTELVTAWFLTEIKNENNSAIRYSYDVINVKIPSSEKRYTREVYLKTISDDEGNKIDFKYSSKAVTEYSLPPVIDTQGNYNTKKVHTRYLVGYSVTTDNYRQDINFIYKVENDKRLLIKIVQDRDPTNQPILQFSYKEMLNSPDLEQVILPTGTSIEFGYEIIGGTSDIIDKINLSCDVSNTYRIDYGQDFVLVSYINKHYHVTLRMFNRALTSEIYSSLSQSKTSSFPFLGNQGVRNYKVKIAEDTLAITLEYDNNKELCLIRKENDEWSLEPKYFNYDKDAIIQVGYDFTAVLDTNNFVLEVILWNKKSKEWSKETIQNRSIINSTDVLLQVSGKVLLVYNDNVAILGYRNKNNEWQSKIIITLPGVISTIKRTLNKFNLQSDIHKQLLNLLKNNAFQISSNFILFNRWNTEGAKLYSEIELFSLNSEYAVVHRENHKIMQDDLTIFSQEILREDDKKKKSYFTIGYEKDGERFKLILKDFRGAIQEEVNEFCKSNKGCISESKENLKKEFNEAHKKDFILNIVKYLANLQAPVALCGTTKFTFNGNNWKVDKLNDKESESKWSISLDDKFVLDKENLQSSIKLYEQGKNIEQKGNLLLDLQVKHNKQIFNKYPQYLVFQTETREVNLFFYEFLNYANVKNTFILPRGESLSLMSDPYTLVTHAESTGDTENLTLNFRQFFGLKSNLPNSVIKKLTVNFDYEYKRVTGYNYDQSSVKAVGDILYYEKTYKIPGNERSSYGMIEELKNITGNLNTVYKIYDARGKLIKIIRDDQFSNNNNNNKTVIEENESLNSILLDITGNLEVAQFYPYEMQDEEVGYYGFENYEVNKIGVINSANSNRWLFNEYDIVKQEFSLTGENYLRLSNSRLEGTFQPSNQNQNYVASCWIRSPGKMLEVGTIAPYLKAVIYTTDNRELNGYLGEIKFQYDDWYYLEVVIDFSIAQQIFSNLVSNSYLTSKTFKIVVSVSPTLNNSFHVDHIRFSPLNSNFQATTYNFKTREIKEIINANGLIKRYLYNDYSDQIVSINENREIEKFSTSTKASSIGRVVSLKSKIEILSNRGFYEDFNPNSFLKRWKVDNDANWKISPAELHHRSNNYDKLKLRNMHTSFDSYGIRLNFSLQSELSTIKFNDVLYLVRRGDNAFVVLFSKKFRPVPLNGEILLIAEYNRLMVWIDGGLHFDEGGLDKSLFDLDIYGQVKISNMLILIEPNVHITYFNALDEKVQTVSLEAENTVILTEFLYDDLGRQCITTKPMRLQRSVDQSLVAYYSNFVANKNPLSANSVWKIGRIQGEFERLDPYSFYQITYNNNPLNEKSVVGLAGQEFSVSGPYAKRFTSTTNNQFINRHYPVDQNYRYQVELKLGGIEDIKVFNNKNNTVAWLVNVPGKSDLLATYEYNDDGKLTQTLSPLYHEKIGTFRKLNSQIRFFSNTKNEPDNSLHVEAFYDKMGNTIAKTAFDSGKVEYLYSDDNLLKFNIFYSSFQNSAIENVVYYNYDHLGRLINTGKLISPPPKDQLLNLQLTKTNTEEYQVFYQSDFEREPTLRGRLKRTITYNDGAPFIEELLLNEDKNSLSKRIFVFNENSDEPLIITTNKMYKAGKLRQIEYPIDVQGKTLKVTYSYDKLGRIKAIGMPEKSNLFIDYIYNSNGQIEYEHHLPDRSPFNFTRKYSYNSASYLTQLEDKFLTENIYYTTGSYDARGYGDGTISRTEFQASWHQYADSSKLGLNEKSFSSEHMSSEESKLCFNKLKEAGYLNQYNRQTKNYYPSIEVEFPIVCSKGITSRQIQNILGKEGFPSKYGHLYDYGSYQELIKAKYFVGDEIPEPLQPNIFAKKIPNLNEEMSRDIWKVLKNNGYIVADKEIMDDSYFKPHGKQGNSFIRSTLYEDLKNINYRYYHLPLEKVLTSYFSKKQDLSSLKSNLRATFSKWSQTMNTEPNQEVVKDANVIIDMLEKQYYLQNPLDKKFNDLLIKYKSVIPEIVEVLLDYFNKQLGESEFDVEAYDIDENGNHKHYYNGFDRYELKYRNNSNQIESINFKSFASSIPHRNFLMKHDSLGNVVQALHKGIKNITYHSVSNRATNIELVSGKKLILYYDARGERVLKRVIDAAGVVKKEVHYVRDEFGRSLVEREMIWSLPNLPPSVLVTVFIYGPKGLVGFIRRDEYYSVITDHEGSIRLIVKNGEVVAAYDYLPYGNLMRQYGMNSEAHISYRYTGQEWDEEIGLYNYHTRFYDPSIGRFYQHDPKMQYFSPYKYAGNSPVSMIDPDGEIAFFLIFAIIGFGFVGGYMGGAAAMGTFDITKWNFKDPQLYGALFFGSLGGALIPIMVPYSVAAFSAMGLSFSGSIAATSLVGFIGTYLGMARAVNEWDPSKWDFSRPELWNGGFVGFSTFVGAPGGIHSAVNFYVGLSSIYGKGLFVIASGAAAGGLIGMRLAGRKLDFSKPEVYVDIMESLIFAADIPMALHGGQRFFRKNINNIVKGIKNKISMSRGYTDLELVQDWNSIIAKSTANILGSTVIASISGTLTAAIASENGLDFSSASTYQALITGAMMSRGLTASAQSRYKKRKILEKLQPDTKSRKIAKDTLDVYKKVVEEPTVRDKLFTGNTDNVQNMLNKGEIPNSVIAVAVTSDNKAFVAFSGDAGPGFLSTYDLEGVSQSHLISPDNSYVGLRLSDPENANSPKIPWKIALSDDIERNNQIEQSIQTKRNNLQKQNYDDYNENVETFKRHLDEEILSNLPHEVRPYFDNDEIQRIVKEIGSKIETDGYVSEISVFHDIITRPLREKCGSMNAKVNAYIKDFNKLGLKPNKEAGALRQLERKIDNYEYNELKRPQPEINTENLSLEGQKQNVRERLERLETMKEQIRLHYSALENSLATVPSIVNNRNVNKKLINAFWDDHIKMYKEKFTHWSITNCAEPHVVSLLSRGSTIFHSVGRTYNLDDIEYLAAYRITHNRKIPEIFPIARCSNCEEITKYVKNVITDPVWEGIFVNEKNKMARIKGQEGHFYRSLNFFAPSYIFDKREKKRHGHGKDLEDVVYSRKKRATIQNNNRQNLDTENYDDTSEHYEKSSDYVKNQFIDEFINHTKEKSLNYTNNFFGWMKTSINKLFDSKKISDTDSNPITSRRITDSNSNLTTVTSLVDINSTLLLLDTTIRKITGQKHFSTTDENSSFLESTGYSLDIGLAFEKVVKYAASKSGISMHRFNIHYMDIQDKIIDKIMSGKLDEIADILTLHAAKACPRKETGCPGKLSPKKFDKFIDFFSQRIDIELNEIMQKNKKIRG